MMVYTGYFKIYDRILSHCKVTYQNISEIHSITRGRVMLINKIICDLKSFLNKNKCYKKYHCCAGLLVFVGPPVMCIG